MRDYVTRINRADSTFFTRLLGDERAKDLELVTDAVWRIIVSGDYYAEFNEAGEVVGIKQTPRIYDADHRTWPMRKLL